MKKYPYQETILANLPDELWKDIPQFEGYYQASNLGRIRSLDRIVPHPRLKQQFVKGRVLHQSIAKNVNTISDVKMVDLRVTLNVNGKAHYFNTRRLIYITFINQNIDFSIDKLNIIHKDCDGFNNHVDNLVIAKSSEKTNRAINRNRVPISFLSIADRTNWPKPGTKRRKPVKQINCKTEETIAIYPSITQASKTTGIGEKEIINVAKGKYKQWNGFIWEYI